MPLDMFNRPFNHEKSASLNVTVLNRPVRFFFPDNSFIRNVILSIFKGEDYPLLHHKDYCPSVIFDIGANIGATALYFLSEFPTAKLYCYEPSSRNYHYLVKNTGCFRRIKSYPYGLFNKSEEMFIHYGKDQCAQDSIFKSQETITNGEKVALVDVCSEIENRGISEISLMKVDTEGCEIPILTSLLQLEWLKINMLYMEYHCEEDRLYADSLLSNQYFLFYSSAMGIHRGTVGYILKTFAANYPMVKWVPSNKDVPFKPLSSLGQIVRPQ